METPLAVVDLDVESLREAIRDEYTQVACDPAKGFHFHTGRKLAAILNYKESWLSRVPEKSIESFAGTGNPFAIASLKEGERVVDVGCGAGIDSLIAASMVGPRGSVIGIDMTEAMREKARGAVAAGGFEDFAITWRGDVFADAPQETSAADFGTVGITFKALKPA